MGPEDRIRRMEDDGILTERQAAMLRDSLSGTPKGRPTQPEMDGRKRWMGRILGGLVLAIVAVFLGWTRTRPRCESPVIVEK